MNFMIDAIKKVVEGEHLSESEAEQAMAAIMDGMATPAQIAALVTALRMKGETVEEITGFVRAMRERSAKVKCSRSPLIDTCGTGGDKLNTFNISTAAAFVAAGAGAAVAKHGNRAASSKCGSADVLEALGVRIALSPEDVGRCIDECGIGFMFAPLMHPAMKHAIGPRKEIGIRTVFNILGPMTNPAGADRQLIGVFAPHLCKLVAKVLSRLGAERAMVVHGVDGLDEVSTIGDTIMVEWYKGEIISKVVNPAEMNVPTANPSEIAGGETPEDNAKILLAVMQGERGARRDAVVVNAAAALLAAGRADTTSEAMELAAESIDSGAAMRTLESLRKFTQECAAS